MSIVLSVNNVDYYTECSMLSLNKNIIDHKNIYVWLGKISKEARKQLDILAKRYIPDANIVTKLPNLDKYILLEDNIIVNRKLSEPYPFDDTVKYFINGIEVNTEYSHTDFITKQSTGMRWNGNFGHNPYVRISRYVVPPPYLYEMTRNRFDVPLYPFKKNNELLEHPESSGVNTSDNSHSNNVPLISAIMITRMRLKNVKIALKCFFNQSYPNKELIILCDNDEETKQYITSIKDNRIKLVYFSKDEIRKLFPNGVTLGGLRNLSVKYTKGEYIIQWDDDDWYHPGRISSMFSMVLKKKVHLVNLGQWVLAGPEIGSYAISHYRSEGWEGSSIFHRSIFEKVKYPEVAKSEDREFQNLLIKQGFKVFTINNVSWAYLYIYLGHGSGTWGMKHFQNLLLKSERITDQNLIMNINDLLETSSGDYVAPSTNWLLVGVIIGIIVVGAIIMLILYLGKKG